MSRFCYACIEGQLNQQAHYDGCFVVERHLEDHEYLGEIIPMINGWGAWNGTANKQVV